MENNNKGTKRQVESIKQCVNPTAESQGLQQSGMENKNKRTKRKVERIKQCVNPTAESQGLQRFGMENKNKGTKRQVESIKQCVNPTAESQGLQQSGMENKNKRTKRKVERIKHRVITRLTVQEPANLKCGSSRCNDPSGAISSRCLKEVMKLADPNAHLIGVYGSNDELTEHLIKKVCRRVHLEKLFDQVLTVTKIKKPDVKKIQEEIARQLGFTFKNKSKDKRADELIGKLKNKKKILIILGDLHKGLDLGKVGIPYGTDHPGCKILLTSPTKDMLANQMHIQSIFNIVAP